MGKVFILYPHGLGDCILLTSALREHCKKTGFKSNVAILERFKSSKIFDNNPYIDKIFYTKDAWNDYSNHKIGFRTLKDKWHNKSKKEGLGKFIMPMHSKNKSKILINFESLGITYSKNYKTEIYTKEKDAAIAKKLVNNLVGNKKFGFIQTNTGVKNKNLPKGYGRKWLKKNRGLDSFIEIGREVQPFTYNINIQFEILRLASAVCLPDSVFYHACHAIGKNIDFAYFARGPSIHSRVKPIVGSKENIIYKL